eukprot:6214449-Pleurochrysis_carterae.AAC.2
MVGHQRGSGCSGREGIRYKSGQLSRRRASRRRRSRAWPAMPPKTSMMSGVTIWPWRRASRYCAPRWSGAWPRMSVSSRGSV